MDDPVSTVNLGMKIGFGLMLVCLPLVGVLVARGRYYDARSIVAIACLFTVGMAVLIGSRALATF